ncbi:T9SS type A sorting domain-containing protein [candidate division TA06 bacterium]|nr:T9SS type A sorting domain-containing protein [candidate division TA06 bacterium]
MPDDWYTTAPLDSLSATRSTNAHNGTYSLKLSQRGVVFGSFSVNDLVRVVGNNLYDFNIWTKNILSVGVLWFIQYNADTSIAFDTLLIPLSLGWKNVGTTIVTEPEALFMAVGATVLVGTIYFDDATLEGNPGGIEEGSKFEVLRSRFELFQNRPNPFSSRTMIRFELPTSGFVALKIYDITGRITNTLMNEKKEAGVYALLWNGLDTRGGELPSGVYFYRLTSGGFTETKKTILLR